LRNPARRHWQVFYFSNGAACVWRSSPVSAMTHSSNCLAFRPDRSAATAAEEIEDQS